MAFQDVFIIGATGRVGRTLVEQIILKQDNNPAKHAHPTRIVGVASSRHYLFSPEGLSDEQSRAFTRHEGDTAQYSSLGELLHLPFEKRREAHSLVFVDVTAEKDMLPFHLKVIEETPYSLITANKNPLVLCDYRTFQRLTRNPRKYEYRCSVMAGAEAVTFLMDLKDTDDRPQLIKGCFSGTLGYICSQLGERPFSEILADAHRQGYTEPHPRDDLNGLDVAKKLLILSRTAGYAAEFSDIRVQPFLPETFLEENDVEAFMRSLKSLDEHFAGRAKNAAASGNVLRYVAMIDAANPNAPALTVSLQEVPRGSQLGSLQGTLNKILVVSQTYPGTAPYSVEAPGAGLQVTAQNIRRGLLSLLPERYLKD